MKKNKKIKAFKQRRIRKVVSHRKPKKVVGKKNKYKISFLQKEKSFADKWIDIIEKEKHFSYNSKGDFSERIFFNRLKKYYGVSKKVHNLFLNNVADKEDRNKINLVHKGLASFDNLTSAEQREMNKLLFKKNSQGGFLDTQDESFLKELKRKEGKKIEHSKYKTESPRRFTKHDFTLNNFFTPPKGWRKLQFKWRQDRITGKKSKFFTEQFYFRCGLKMVYKSKSSGVYIQDENGKQAQVYIMDKVPISSYSFEPFSKGWKTFFETIKDHVHGFDSLWFFQFLYLDVTIL